MRFSKILNKFVNLQSGTNGDFKRRAVICRWWLIFYSLWPVLPTSMQQLPFSFVSGIQGDLWFCSDCAVAVGQLPCCVPSTSPQLLLPIFTVALPPFPTVVRAFALKVGDPWSRHSSALRVSELRQWRALRWRILAGWTGESFRGSTLQRKGWHVCGWSPKACHRRRKPVPWWIHSLFQPLQGDWYSLQGVHSTTKRHFTYRIFFPF